MKTTVDIPGDLFRKAKAMAAIRGESLEALIRDALEAHLAAIQLPHADRSGWRSVFGLADPKSVESIDKIVTAEFERIDPSAIP